MTNMDGFEAPIHRESQAGLLGNILSFSAPPAFGIHGPPSSGKTLTLMRYLEASGMNYSVVNCDQCTTTRILLQRALRSILAKTGTGTAEEAVAENVEIFSNVIFTQFAQNNYTTPHVLVLDRIDRLPDSNGEVYSCLTRLPELSGITNLTTIFVYSTPEAKQLISSPIPHVYFPPYTQDEAVSIIGSMDPPATVSVADPVSYWREFVRVAVLALNPHTGTDIRLISKACSRLWPLFIEDADPNFNKQYLNKQKLFQAEDFIKQLDSSDDGLSQVQKYLLVAAYLASYNDSRYDVRFFSRAKEAHAKRRDTRPRNTVQIPARSLAPPTFEYERWLAIFHALLPDPLTFVPCTDVGTSISTLCAQNMVVMSQEDPLDSRTKWRINISWGFVESLAKDIGMYIEEYILE